MLSFVGGRSYRNQHLAQRWIRHTTAEDRALLRWPSRSPDLTTCYFFLMRLRYGLFLPTLPQYLPQLRRRIMAAISEIGDEVLQHVFWKWIIVFMSAMSKGENTKHLRSMQKEPWRVALPSVGRMLQSLPSCKCTDFMKCVREL